MDETVATQTISQRALTTDNILTDTLDISKKLPRWALTQMPHIYTIWITLYFKTVKLLFNSETTFYNTNSAHMTIK
jgi:hypothetical protein